MISKETKFILAIALQVMIIFAIIIFKVSILSGGSDVLLKIAPVDPRDPLRGDYVTFRYDISNVPPYLAHEQIRNGDSVYVLLRQSRKYWIVQDILKNKPDEGSICIKGRVQSGGLQSEADPLLNRRFGGQNLLVVYGLEEYFIPEGTGRNFTFWNKEAFAKVAVDENCNAVLKQIYVGDEPWP